MKINFPYTSKKTVLFPVASFSEIYKYTTALCLDPLHQKSLSSDNEFGKYACKLIYVRE
jgi:hypothetical protein